MSKRFIDNSVLPKAWRKLTPSLKLTWYYLWNNCDASGVWEIDEDLFEFENGFEFNQDQIINALPDLLEIFEDKILIKDFISINQCEISKLNENYNPHKPVFRAINKHNLKLNPSLNQASFKLVVGVEVEVVEEVNSFEGGAGETFTAWEFLNKEALDQVEAFEMQNKEQLGDNWQTFIDNFNSKVILEEIDFSTKKLFARLRQLKSNWKIEKSSDKKESLSPMQMLRKKHNINV